MSKTAEEILNEHFCKSVPANIPMWDSAVNAANEFAAQEVESYKKRLLDNMEKLHSESEPTLWEKGWNMARLASIAVINQTPIDERRIVREEAKHPNYTGFSGNTERIPQSE